MVQLRVNAAAMAAERESRSLRSGTVLSRLATFKVVDITVFADWQRGVARFSQPAND